MRPLRRIRSSVPHQDEMKSLRPDFAIHGGVHSTAPRENFTPATSGRGLLKRSTSLNPEAIMDVGFLKARDALSWGQCPARRVITSRRLSNTIILRTAVARSRADTFIAGRGIRCPQAVMSLAIFAVVKSSLQPRRAERNRYRVYGGRTGGEHGKGEC